MIRARSRRNHVVINLGLPERISAENEETKVEEKVVQRPSSSRRPPLASSSVTRATISHGKENRYQAGTPREKPALSNNKQIPNSTYPTSVCGSSTSINKSVSLIAGGKTPSSTFPVSLPITGAPNTQDAGVTEPDTFAAPEDTDKVHTKHSEEQGVETSKCGDVRMDEISNAVTSRRRDSDDRGTPAIATTSIPPLPFNTTSAANAQPVSQDPGDIVTMGSAAGEKRFKRLRLLGCGGSSKVFKVVGESDYQTYALKEVYLKHVDPAIKTAYINEIKLLKKLSDKSEIITLHHYTYNKQDGVLHLLLEYAEMDLNAALKSHTTANRMATVLYFWNQMLEVVKVIHDEGVIHNDLKPENFVCIGARLKLIDFGIANRIEAEKTSIERDIRCGTINYMAPETIEANDDLDCFKVGRPSDIWSLGCILYQMIYGRTPFQHIKNKLKKWQAIIDPSVTIPFPQISSPSALNLMKRCLSRNPKERPTIDELLNHPFSTMEHS